MAELLVAYFLLMLVLGPGTVVYGAIIVTRRRAVMFRGKTVRGALAVIAGIVTIVAGFTCTYFMWYMGRYFPH